MQGFFGMPGGPEEPEEEEEPWEPLPPRSMRPVAAIAAVVLVSGISGFGTFAYIAGNTEHVTSADGAGEPVVTTTTATTTEPAETTTSAPEEEDSEDTEASDDGHEGHESDDETTTTSAPPEDSGGDSSSGLSPEDTVKAFFDAMKEGDCETAFNYMTEQSWSRDGTLSREEAVSQCEQSPPMAGVDVHDAKLANESGDSATVDVTVSQAGQTMTAPMMLQREDGQWKLVNM